MTNLVDKILPMHSFKIRSTKDDEEQLNILFGKNVKKEVVCKTCGGNQFIVQAFTDTELLVSFSSNTLEDKCVILHSKEDKEIYGIKIIKCHVCGSEQMEIKTT